MPDVAHREEALPPVTCPSSRGMAPSGSGMAARSLVLVVGVWWLATGLIVAMERDERTRALGMVVATGLGATGAWLAWSRRSRSEPDAVRAGFAGGALVWLWLQAAFYGGWVVGSGLPARSHQRPGLGLAFEAVRATSASDALAIAAVLGAWIALRRAPNRAGLSSLATFWGLHQIAKLNVFFGVANPASDFLPDHLAFLRTYFGPERNSPLMPITVVALAALAVWLGSGFVAHRRPADRQRLLLLCILVSLGALEHLALSGALRLALWTPFLKVRG